MALPKNGTKLVPDEDYKLYNKYEEWAAWYSSDPTTIANFYERNIYNPTPEGSFWASAYGKKRRQMLHVPMAADLAKTSADLLFGESPKIVYESEASQARSDEIMEQDNLVGKIAEAAETGAALSGVFLKVNWDRELADYPILNIAQTDNVIPEFKFGFLTAVEFRKPIDYDGNLVYYHVERHEMRGRSSYIMNGLYIGTLTTLDRRLELSKHPYTANMQDEIKTNIPSLLVRYIPNMRPNRLFRGSSIGMSDYGGIEGLMDALDETYTSWMRDIKLGKARIMVPETWLKKEDNGEFTFDADEEIFTKVDMDPMSAKEKGAITPIEFQIRTQQHMDTAIGLIERIVTSSGYSPQTFGLNIEGSSESGTALNIRERKTANTAEKKQNYWKRPLEDILEIMLMVDKQMLGNQTEVSRPSIEFADPMKSDSRQLAETVELIRRAKAGTNRTLVAMLHPDWTTEQVEEEAAALDREQGMLEDPMQQGVPD